MDQLLLPAPDMSTLRKRLIDAAVCWVQKTGSICRLDMYSNTGERLRCVITPTSGHSFFTMNRFIWRNASYLDISKIVPDLIINLSAGIDMLAGMIDLLED